MYECNPYPASNSVKGASDNHISKHQGLEPQIFVR